MGSLVHGARRFCYLVRLEAREARAIFGFAAVVGLLVTLGVAWWTARSGGEVSLGWPESLGLAGLVQLLLIPVLADVFSAGDERAAQRLFAGLPVASGMVFLARWAVVLAAAVTMFLGLALAWAALAVLAPAGPHSADGSQGMEGPWAPIAVWLLSGFPVLTVLSYSATCSVALVFRHGLSATIVGVCIILSVTALLVDPEVMNRGESLLQLEDSVVSVLFSPFTPIALALTLWAAFRLRGMASRSWVARAVRVGAAVAMCSGVAAGAVEFKEWRRQHYRFNDPDALIGAWPGVSANGRAALLTLERDEVRSGWLVDLTSGEVERATKAHLMLFASHPTLTFDRGLERRETAVVREPDLVNDSWVRRVVEERWASEFGGPPMTVVSIHVISPRRRQPHIAYYIDAERWFHRVDLGVGSDVRLDIRIDGEPMTAGVDEDGRWVTWNSGRDEDAVLRGVNLVTGERFEHEPESRETRVFGNYFMASFGGGPVLMGFSKDGPSHFTVREGRVVPLPFVRRYSKIADVDGKRLIGCTDDGGVYLIGPGGEETMVLRAVDV